MFSNRIDCNYRPVISRLPFFHLWSFWMRKISKYSTTLFNRVILHVAPCQAASCRVTFHTYKGFLRVILSLQAFFCLKNKVAYQSLAKKFPTHLFLHDKNMVFHENLLFLMSIKYFFALLCFLCSSSNF